MFAVSAVRIDPKDPLAGLAFGERPEPAPRPGWTTVTVKAASLNHHDLWTLRGVGISEDKLPMILGCDGAGLDEQGNEVLIHSVVDARDGKPSIFTEQYDGTFATKVLVPEANLVPKPAELSWEEAVCLPTAWLTAYRMLFRDSRLTPGHTVLVQGAGGGVATALIVLARAAGLRVWATSRSEEKRARALDLGAHAVFESGARLPERVDAVMETVGAATWSHSLKSLRPEGTLVISGATSGTMPPAELNRIFFLQLRVIGSTMGSKEELKALVGMLAATGARPVIDTVLPLAEARAGFERMAEGEAFGKIVFTV
jgi:NADPH:quinone reductase-like Zn-dependent oxidoreductase